MPSLQAQPLNPIRQDARRNRSWIALVTLMLFTVLLTTTGCTVKSVDGDTQTVTFELWVPLTVIIASILGVVVGWFLRRWSTHLAYVGMGLGCLGILLLAPAMLLDYAKSTKENFELRTGFWFMPTQKNVKYEEIGGVVLTKRTTGGRRRSTSYQIECQLKSGERVEIPIGDLMKRGGLELFMSGASAHNIPISDQR